MSGLIIQSSAPQVPNITAPLHTENVIIIHHQWCCV